ncbi:MAG: signal recognition particle protein [Chloroflexi bacterium]|nr:signal recognition particle protein [Chloroflexota bacterium]
MFESLSEKLQGVFGRLGSRGTVTEKDLDDALREVRLALLEADVNFKVVKDFVAHVRERALGAEIHKALKPHEQIISFVNDELVETLGKEAAHLNRGAQPPTVVMLVGLQGSGKTTMASKLALFLRGRGDKPLLVACDVYRPAAVEQLKTLGRGLDIPVYDEGTKVTPLQIARNAMAEARRMGATVVILDTAGRLHIDQQMMSEVTELRDQLKPHEVLFVMDALIGQEAVKTAEEFHKAVGITGMVLTKMDGDARGGAALSIRHVVGVPIKFVGVGEKPDALEAFFPDRMASRILGMGDMMTLIDKAKAAIGDEDVKGLEKKMKSGQFDLDDFVAQLQRVKNMGSISSLISMLPGAGNIKKQLGVAGDMDEDFFKQVEAIIYSMTPRERRHPEIISGSRRKRIAIGSGTKPQDVNQLLKQFAEAKKIMKVMTNTKGRGLGGVFGMLR